MKERLNDKVDKPKPDIKCPHFTYCNITKFGRINCLTKTTIRECRIYKFYEKYGEDYNQLGVGS